MSKIITNKFIVIIFAILLVSFLFYIIKTINKQTTNLAKQNQRLQISTSFYPLYYFTSQIVLDKADIYNVTPAGAEPHSYEPTTRDITKIENSQLLIINGNNFEAWAKNIITILKKNTPIIINISKNLAEQNLIEKNSETRDPHFWLNPKIAQSEVKIILDNLMIVDPTNARYYVENSNLLLNKLDELDVKFRTGLINCQKNEIITAHAAFGYLANEYGFNQIAISGLSPDEEPSPKKLSTIADFAKQNQVEYIFFESMVSPKLANTIASEIGAKTLVLNPIEGITQEDIKNGKTYFTEMNNNLINLKIALQCQ